MFLVVIFGSNVITTVNNRQQHGRTETFHFSVMVVLSGFMLIMWTMCGFSALLLRCQKNFSKVLDSARLLAELIFSVVSFLFLSVFAKTINTTPKKFQQDATNCCETRELLHFEVVLRSPNKVCSWTCSCRTWILICIIRFDLQWLSVTVPIKESFRSHTF